MFGMFKTKALEARVSVLEEEIKKALDSKKEVMAASSEVIALQEKVQQNLEQQLKAAQRMVRSLSSQNRKLTRASATTERGVVGSGKLSNEDFAPAKVPKPSRMESIKKAVDKMHPPKQENLKQVKVLGEITPRGVSLGKLPVKDRAAIISDILGVEVVATSQNGIQVKGLDTKLRVMPYRESTKVFNIKLTEDCYALVADPVTNKYYLTFLSVKDTSKSGSYTFTQNSVKLSSIRTNHAKTLQVLKDKLK